MNLYLYFLYFSTTGWIVFCNIISLLGPLTSSNDLRRTVIDPFLLYLFPWRSLSSCVYFLRNTPLSSLIKRFILFFAASIKMCCGSGGCYSGCYGYRCGYGCCGRYYRGGGCFNGFPCHVGTGFTFWGSWPRLLQNEI